MNYKEEVLFNFIKSKIPENSTLVNEIADVLDISNHGAYRRINGSTNLSFKETMLLTKHYYIPLNELYDLGRGNNLYVYKKENDGTEKGLIDYFNTFTETISEFYHKNDSSFIYASKDFPIYHSLSTPLLRKFKLYAFTNQLSDKKYTKNKVHFKDFTPSKPLEEAAENVTKALRQVSCTELWNNTTLNSVLHQIYYFFELNLLCHQNAIDITNSLLELVKEIEVNATQGYLSSTKTKYSLYLNKLINLNNTIFFKHKDTRSLILPYTTLSFVKIDHKETCDEIEVYYEKQLKFSKSLSGNSEIERKLFFATFYENIEKLKQQIDLKNQIDFL